MIDLAQESRGRIDQAKIVVVSDSAAGGRAKDTSGPALEEFLVSNGFEVTDLIVIADGRSNVASCLKGSSEGFHGLIVTTGGTGLAPQDQTPEGTLEVLDRLTPGLSEAMRAINPLGRLSRGVSGTRGTALIVNLPGSPRGALENLSAVIDVIPHALELLDGHTSHGDSPRPT